MAQQYLILNRPMTASNAETISEVDIPVGWSEFFATQAVELATVSRKVGRVTIPRACFVFEPFYLTPVQNVRVVIIGQDPYPTVIDGRARATGLAFSYAKTDGVSASMRNVLTEIRRSYPDTIASHTNLGAWADQGVLLINTCLTFSANAEKPTVNDHMTSKIWTKFVSDALKYTTTRNPNAVVVCWGRKAEDFVAKSGAVIEPERLLVAPHPSPLARGFVGCGHFTKINELIDGAPIDWSLRQ